MADLGFRQSSITLFGILQLCIAVLSSTRPALRLPSSIAAAALSCLDSVAFGLLSHTENRKSLRPSVILNCYLFFSLLFDSVQARTRWLNGHDVVLDSLFTTALSLKAVILILESLQQTSLGYPSHKDVSPEETAGLFGLSLFTWLNQLIMRGFRRVLLFEDLYPIEEKMSADKLRGQFWGIWSSCK
jgi:ATP-binding cassette subfamily C (CFTR/MRP) protein 1